MSFVYSNYICFHKSDITQFSLQAVCSRLNKQNPDYMQGKSEDDFVTYVFGELDMDKDGYISEHEFMESLTRQNRKDILGGILAFALPQQ